MVTLINHYYYSAKIVLKRFSNTYYVKIPEIINAFLKKASKAPLYMALFGLSSFWNILADNSKKWNLILPFISNNSHSGRWPVNCTWGSQSLAL